MWEKYSASIWFMLRSVRPTEMPRRTNMRTVGRWKGSLSEKDKFRDETNRQTKFAVLLWHKRVQIWSLWGAQRDLICMSLCKGMSSNVQKKELELLYIHILIYSSKGVTGPNCNELDKSGMPCSSSPCFGDSTCVNLADRFICVCAAGKLILTSKIYLNNKHIYLFNSYRFDGNTV